MKDIYDNGCVVIGNVYNLKKYIEKCCKTLEEYENILCDLEDLKDDTIVSINYDLCLGYSIECWKKEHKVNN